MKNEELIRADIVEIGRRLHGREYIASNDGNISVRLDDNRFFKLNIFTAATASYKGNSANL